MSGRDFATRHMLSSFIIKELSATADGSGRESADRIAARNNRESILCNSVSGETAEYALRYRVVRALLKLPGQICTCKSSERFSEQICVGVRMHHIRYHLRITIIKK